MDTQLGEIETQLQKAKNDLKDLNQVIRKIVGRPIDGNDRSDRKRVGESRRFSESNSIHKRRLTESTKSVFNRLSGTLHKSEDESKPRVSSRVIKEQPSREEIVAAQGNDENTKARNRRMFGSLVGTLQKFCQEENKLKYSADKKAQIEKKLDEKQRREKELLRKEKQSLLCERRKQQLEIRMLEIKMVKVKELEIWESKKQPLSNFIRTKSSPHLYFLPKYLTSKMEQRLKKTRDENNSLISKKRKQVEADIAAIEMQFCLEIKTIAENSDCIAKNCKLLKDKLGQTSDTEVSLVEHNIEPIAFESDSEIVGRGECVENISVNYNATSYTSKPPTPPSTFNIKKEKFDEEKSLSSEEQ